MEFTNSLFEETHADVYDHIHSELLAKRNEHKELLRTRTVIRKKIHAYESAAADLRAYLSEVRSGEPLLRDLSDDIEQVMTIPQVLADHVESLRMNLHRVVLRETRYIRMRISMLEEVIQDMKTEVGTDVVEYIPSNGKPDCGESVEIENRQRGTCPICYDQPVGHCLTPCGHCVCDGCLGRDDTMIHHCFMCRAPVIDVVKIYL
jgi:hypothetical protein